VTQEAGSGLERIGMRRYAGGLAGDFQLLLPVLSRLFLEQERKDFVAEKDLKIGWKQGRRKKPGEAGRGVREE